MGGARREGQGRTLKPLTFVSGKTPVSFCAALMKGFATSQLCQVRKGCLSIINRPLVQQDGDADTRYVNNFEDKSFNAIIHAAEDAIATGCDPERIVQGSSGSYFVRNCEGVGVGEAGGRIVSEGGVR